jgi:hypothetical protein
MNVLHISFMNQDEVSSLITGAGASLDDYTITTYTGAETFEDYDVIVIGMNDGGVDISDILEDLITARDNGVPLLFTHDCPRRDCFDLDGIDLTPLGFTFFQDNYEYDLYTDIHINNASHALLTSPYNISEGFTIEQTHGVGQVLQETCEIIIENPNLISGSTNFYLATKEEVSKGKIVYWTFGHNRYNSTQFFTPLIAECKLFINALQWLNVPLTSSLYGNLS